jgi:hypothetical protein
MNCHECIDYSGEIGGLKNQIELLQIAIKSKSDAACNRERKNLFPSAKSAVAAEKEREKEREREKKRERLSQLHNCTLHSLHIAPMTYC